MAEGKGAFVIGGVTSPEDGSVSNGKYLYETQGVRVINATNLQLS